MFNQFFIKLDVKPATWEERLILFVGYLVQKRLKANTINSYISAVKAVLKQDDIKISEDRYVLNSLVRACRLQNNHVRIRLPIQKRLCAYLIKQTEAHFSQAGQPYLASVYMSMFVAAYYRMLRVGELTSGAHPVRVTDVQLADNKNKVLFILRSSKTHSRDSRPQLVKLTSVPSKERSNRSISLDTQQQLHFCPYKLIKHYLQISPKYRTINEPFYVFRDHTPITPCNAQSVLHLVLGQLGLCPSNYRMHSFRVGRSVDMFHSQIEIGIIKKVGRWKSNIVYSYLNH